MSGRMTIIQPTYPHMEEQDAENHRAIAALGELFETAVTVAENYVAYSDGRLPPLGAKGQTLQEACQEFYCRYKHEHPCGWNEDKVMERCEQQVTKEMIQEINKRPVLDLVTLTTSLHQLNTRDKLPRGRYLLLKDNLSVLQPHMGPEAVLNLPDALTALYDVQHVDVTATIREELAEMDAARNGFLSQLNEAQAMYDAAASRGDVVEVERAHRHLIAARYEYIVYCAKRIHHLTSAENDDGIASFANELKRIRGEAEDAVQEFRDEKNKMKEKIGEDIANCEKARDDEDKKHTAAAAAYADREKQANADLAEVVQKKLDLIEEMRRKAVELRDLMELQKKMVQESIDAKRAEEERVTTYNEFVNIEDQHVDRLQRCLAYYQGTSPLIEELEKYVSEMVQYLPEDDAKEALAKLTDEECRAFMKEYREFVFVCGDLTVKKTHRLDTLERQARLTRHNRDSAMDSLDPNMENYRLELEDLVEQMKAVEGVINALNATQDAGEQVYESVEDPIHTMYERAGETFVHPLQEFGIKSVDDRTKFVDRSMKYVEGEESEVMHKRSQIDEMKAIVDRETTALERAITADNAPAAIEE